MLYPQQLFFVTARFSTRGGHYLQRGTKGFLHWGISVGIRCACYPPVFINCSTHEHA